MHVSWGISTTTKLGLLTDSNLSGCNSTVSKFLCVPKRFLYRVPMFLHSSSVIHTDHQSIVGVIANNCVDRPLQTTKNYFLAALENRIPRSESIKHRTLVAHAQSASHTTTTTTSTTVYNLRIYFNLSLQMSTWKINLPGWKSTCPDYFFHK